VANVNTKNAVTYI